MVIISRRGGNRLRTQSDLTRDEIRSAKLGSYAPLVIKEVLLAQYANKTSPALHECFHTLGEENQRLSKHL